MGEEEKNTFGGGSQKFEVRHREQGKGRVGQEVRWLPTYMTGTGERTAWSSKRPGKEWQWSWGDFRGWDSGV